MSRLARRSHRDLGAAGLGERPARCMRANTNRSIGDRAQPAPVSGTGTLAGRGSSDHNLPYTAPSEIHRVRVPISSLERVLPLASGGIGASVLWMRLRIRLSSGLPGTMGQRPPRSAKAPSGVSSRMPAMRLPGSGPWHLKHLSDRMGSTSRPNETFSMPFWACGESATHASHAALTASSTGGDFSGANPMGADYRTGLAPIAILAP